MPSKKKSTKALKANVQRTFNTTSVAKKVTPEEAAVEEPSEAVVEEPAPVLGTTTNGHSEDVGDVVQDAEEYQLQLLAERVKAAAQKEISRTVKAFEYERRLSKTLPRFEWTNTRALEVVLRKALESDEEIPRYAQTYETEEKALVKAAIVYGILEYLGFSKDRIPETLVNTRTLDLEEALDWLVLHCPVEELQFRSAPKNSTTVSSSANVAGLAEIDAPLPSAKMTKPANPTKYKLTAQEIESTRENPTTAFVDAKAELSLLQANKRRHLTNGFSSEYLHNQSKRLQAIMDRASGEYLFDKRDAELAFRRWKVEHEAAEQAKKEKEIDEKMDRLMSRSSLAKELTTDGDSDVDPSAEIADSAGLSNLEQANATATSSKTTSESQAERETSLDPESHSADAPVDQPEPLHPSHQEEEEDSMFGNMLDTPPTEVLSQAGTTITVRDVGLPKGFSGKSPRALLEELCRRRDKFSKVSFSLLGQSNAAQAIVTVRWESGPMQAFSMTEEACQNQVQAFNYVATLALFALDTAAVHRQLPPVFRTIWNELDAKRKAVDDQALRAHTLELQSIVTKRSGQSKDTFKPIKSTNDEQSAHHQVHRQPTFATENSPSLQLQKAFEQRQSSSAYRDMLPQREALPIAAYRVQIMQAIQTSQVVIVSAETGAGKSTQVPAFILEQELIKGAHVKVYCTQPRRISAISLANRVSAELGDAPNACGTRNSLVGYSIRLETRASASTRLVYATTGVVLRMLDNDDSLQGITHLIIDEIHERSIDTDFLMIIVKDILKKRPDLRVILMSATVDAERMSAYMDDCPVVKVPGRTFQVNSFYLEDAIEMTGYRFVEGVESPYALYYKHNNRKSAINDDDLRDSDDENLNSVANVGSGYSKSTKATLDMLDEAQINYELLTLLLEQVCCHNRRLTETYTGAVLVFLPSLESIKRLTDILEAHPIFGSASFQIFPLHSTITSENQIRVFQVPPKGVRKIVIATNIAETGITIPDTTCVIDSGKHREMRFDEKRQISRLIETYIAQSNALQRRGRAGRVQEGLCFHLFTKSRFEEQMAKHPLPEMLRLSLQDLALRIKIMPLFSGTVESVLLRAMDPPLTVNIQRAVASLQEVKALTANEDITPLGLLLAKLPMDVHLGKLLILACLFKCLEPALTIAAALSSKSPFVTPFGRELEADAAKRAFKVDNSDFLSLHKAYTLWRKACLDNAYYSFCRKHFLSHNNLTQIEELRQQFYDLLVECKLAEVPRTTIPSKSRIRFFDVAKVLNENAADNRVVMAVVTAAMFPKLLVADSSGQFRTLTNNAPASIHPSSINFTPGRRVDFGGAKFVTFFNIMSTKKLYAWETGSSDDLAVMLLCGDVDTKLATESVVLDRKVRFAASAKSAYGVKVLRQYYDSIFNERIKHPTAVLTDNQMAWWTLICEALKSEEVEDKGEQESNAPKMTIRF